MYEGTSGYDFNHVRDPQEREWLREAVERGRFRPPETPLDRVALLDRLTQVEVFEQFLHRIFPGKHRFSIEGLDILIPILDECVRDSAERGLSNLMLGMAHRGRLNVLAHILNKPYTEILAEFKDPLGPRKFLDDLEWTGDVKYHKGAKRTVAEPDGDAHSALSISLSANPSHVEAINPAIEGMARAAGTSASEPGPPQFDPSYTMPVLIHGDAGFPGQGVVAETLNLARLEGYTTGGTIHLIANNQLGYTTDPEQGRSTLFASDLAKGFKIPIVHVNADDPVACLEAVRMACAYRAEFHRDFMIDVIGYRRYGHNEGDEPRFTQPQLYEIIEDHPTIRSRWGQQLVDDGVVDESSLDGRRADYMRRIQEVYEDLEPDRELPEQPPEPPPPGAAGRVDTAIDLERLQGLNSALIEIPEDFHLHRKLERVLRGRQDLFDSESSVDWATAEQLAFASILEDGIPIRMTGEDVERGTFSQRHAVFHDVETGVEHLPLQSLPQAQASFEIHNSPLTENAALAFEYGYNVQSPERLVIWEAQYGDFINGAQVPVDELVVSARAKWGIEPSLVLLLPHGYEGAGPDHSSGRIERFLTLSAENNLRVANCTTAAQYFHLLRRQAAVLGEDPLPLVVFTPKSLLRHSMVASTVSDFVEGRWQPVLDLSERPDARRLILCSGKIAVDLQDSDLWGRAEDVAVLRVEQLAPFPFQELERRIDGFEAAQELLWVQEEPENMGAWPYIRTRLNEIVGKDQVGFVGRPASSSPAEGSAAWHSYNQRAIVEEALLGERQKAEEAIVKENK
ncbi:MAG: 2-oxoglutarate dehydrogenase E1 component [Anaerolineales bacterium]|nr:2-oxoglutarate dehydrogenase E1 component [Anaerolineales bacterium]